ncbi:hypothetical protein [Patulibacter sp.]|uniref:hypothetical protein n=1 Tax=Patulibacter sp. TaxID=1912859 RepID=UPI0027250C64|nr:hypothetical protein [Patulibacter sp.]MDO9408595.1 hypothetical protein [Patulibacter sp.]
MDRLRIVNAIDRAATPVDRDGVRVLRRADLPPAFHVPVAAFLGQRGIVLDEGRYVFASADLYRDS